MPSIALTGQSHVLLCGSVYHQPLRIFQLRTLSFYLVLSMSVLVGGVFTSSVSISLTSDVTVVSFDFLRARFPSRLSQERQAQRRLAFTIDGGPHGSFTMELACSVSHVLAADVCMALDWKTGVREWLIGLGLPPSIFFDHLYALVPRGMLLYSPLRPLFQWLCSAGSSELLAMSERWQPVPLRDNINGQ